MAINKASLQSRINNLSKKTGVHQNILLRSFFFDSFLKRLSISKYISFTYKKILKFSRKTRDFD